ncbi:two-component sensor histidine kinase [Paracoccus limosus]|uniref:C4-dicarboxylate transport sensor protein DctB n=1 Tax=Paracoccus limosus TaxID=913252 RepID=A0A844H4D2_9RHOB|nr:ATP-binding protein [Paracoccus limosus]MTH34101.1 two-component sensor histidine kinase [Paracoccus limosus]
MEIDASGPAPASGPARAPLRRVLMLAALAGLVVLLLAAGNRLAQQRALGQGHLRAETALRLTVNALQADLARYEMLPQLIGDLDLIRQLAAAPGDPALRRATNQWLAAQNAALQSSNIYLMRPDGLTIAASNFGTAVSFLGQNFAYRPYFIDAMRGHPARFYGVGTTSGVRGYFFSAPVRDAAGGIAAVVAVKIGVDRIEEAWRGGDYQVMVTDPDGTVFLASDPGWLYHSLNPLTPVRLARTQAARRYADTALTEFPQAALHRAGVELLRLPHAGGGTRDFIAATQAMPGAGWRVHVLLDSAEAMAQARLMLASMVLLLAAGLSGALMLRQRRARIAERLAATAELEHRVIARTADLARVNQRLQQEIAERRATEAELRAAQASLVQVGKLAALGQMSASLSHEINQPLAAARNYADSAAILIERGDYPRARENIAEILALVDRMPAIGKHLRQAARQPGDGTGAVALAPLLRETRTIVAQRLAASGATLELDIPADLPPLCAGPTRLQQVLVNLISNAADAVEGSADRRIELAARAGDGRVTITVRDHGPGVPQAIAARIFDPFFTTKGIGAGLGLGLSITANILRDLGGQISLTDARPGACFRVSLPACPPEAAP